MKRHRIFGFIVMVMILSSCLKRNEITPAPPTKTYYNEFYLKKFDKVYWNVPCFASLKGYIIDVDEAERNSELVDFGIAETTLAAPEATQYFEFSNPNSSARNWPKINKGVFVATNLTQANFDTIRMIENYKSLTQNATSKQIGIELGKTIAFNVTNGYGLIHFKEFDGAYYRLLVKYHMN